MDHPVVHAYIEVGDHDDRGLQPLSQIECFDGQIEALFRIGREQQDMARVAMRGVCAGHDIGLLGTRRHAGRRTASLNVDQHGRNLGEISVSQQFVHQRDTRATRRRKRSRAVPAGPEHHAHGGQLVLGLNNAVFALTRFLIDPIALAECRERIHDGRRGSDRVPGPDGGAGIDATQGRGRIAVDHDVIFRLVHRLGRERQRALEVFPGIVVPEIYRDLIGFEQVRFLRERLLQRLANDLLVDIEQRRDGPDVRDVLHQDARPSGIKVLVAHPRERDADDVDVVAVE
jgi:hypothetical protein